MSAPRRGGRNRGPVVTTRDTELLVSLYKYRFLSLAQVERLFFPSAQTANRRVRILGTMGLVAVFRPPGFPERIVSLTRKGLETVAGALALPAAALGDSPARTRPKDYYFLRHFLAVSDVRIALTRACIGRSDVRLLGFLADHVAEHTEQGGLKRFTRDLAADISRSGEKVAHTPDGVFALRREDAAALFFLEIDRGSEAVADRERGVAKILRFYLNYLASGGFARYEQVFGIPAPFSAVRVLVATSSARRLETIRQVGASLGFEPRRALQFIWLTEISAVTEETIFDQIWVPLDPAVSGRFGIVPKRDPHVSETRECVGS